MRRLATRRSTTRMCHSCKDEGASPAVRVPAAQGGAITGMRDPAVRRTQAAIVAALSAGVPEVVSCSVTVSGSRAASFSRPRVKLHERVMRFGESVLRQAGRASKRARCVAARQIRPM